LKNRDAQARALWLDVEDVHDAGRARIYDHGRDSTGEQISGGEARLRQGRRGNGSEGKKRRSGPSARTSLAWRNTY
jgi:hypothetical protein